MGLPVGSPWYHRRTSRTLSISLLVLLVALLIGPGANALAPHASGAGTAPARAGAPVAAMSAPSHLPVDPLTAHGAGLSSPASAQLRAALHPSTHPSWAPVLPARSTATLSSAAVQAELQRASASLATGAGPAHGTPLTCTPAGGAGASCAVAATSVHPSISSAEQWQNASQEDGFVQGVPYEGYAGAMAYDAYDGYVVYFGGCDYYSCPDNLTWGYSGYVWFQISTAFSPPATTLPAMDFDATYNIVVLYGGCGNYECPSNWTYIYSGALGWENITNALIPGSPYLSGASMVYAADSLDGYSMMFGGCTYFYYNCLALSNTTWGLSGSGWVTIPTAVAPEPSADQSIAYDPVLNESLLFGGCTYSGCSLNFTWVYYNLTWYNASAFLAAIGPVPAGRGYAVLTFDELDNELVLYGGTDFVNYYGDTWTLSCGFIFCSWANVTVAGQEIPALWAAVAPSQSNASMGTMLFGGEFYVQGVGYLSNGTYVFEPGLQIAPSVPSTAPARSGVPVQANPTGGSGGFARYAFYGYYVGWQYGTSSAYGADANLTFPAPGTYLVNLTVVDYFSVAAFAQFTVVATGPTTAITGGAATDVGTSLALTATAASGGNSPYNYTWSFADGSFGYGLSVSHAWSSTGTYAVVLEVTDAANLTFNATKSVTVVAAPSVTVAASHSTIDLGMSIAFTPTVTGGTAPDSYSWAFGDGTTASTATSPTHTFTTTGTYKVVLNVTDGVGVVASGSVTVTVNPALGGSASASATSVTAGTSDTFTASATGGTPTYTYAWVFGDGKTGTGASVDHTYATAGTYSAKVWINDSVGGTYSTAVTVTVASAPGGSGTSGSSGGLSGTTLYIVIAVIILVVAALAAVMWMRRRKPSPPMSAPPSGAAGIPTPPPAGATPAWSENPPPPGAGGSP